MSQEVSLKNKLFKGLTEHDILTWEEEKMRYQRKMGRKVTDLDFLRYLLMRGTRPIISSKDGVAGGYLTGQNPVYEKAETILEKYRTREKESPRAVQDRESARTKIDASKRLLDNP
ncbi:hypothetical protein EU527_15215 [Candidatus Thorarchaeota archaeon]|nr:MAG: hypothetical protein EU527_15215 [Candidatus Thorarchaeota archaeon]